MEPEGSLPSSQELSTCTYPEPDQSSPLTTNRLFFLEKMMANIKILHSINIRENNEVKVV
jgi:hypothetical protein